MKDSYDFSKSVKNPYLRKPKKQLTIRLDEDVATGVGELEKMPAAPCRVPPKPS